MVDVHADIPAAQIERSPLAAPLRSAQRSAREPCRGKICVGSQVRASFARAYEEQTGRLLGIESRPPATELVRLAQSMPGNVARLEDIVARPAARLLLTLGSGAGRALVASRLLG